MNRASYLDCKHKHMKNGAPPDNFGILDPQNSRLVTDIIFFKKAWVPFMFDTETNYQ